MNTNNKQYDWSDMCNTLIIFIVALLSFCMALISFGPQWVLKANHKEITVQELQERIQDVDGYIAILETIKYYKAQGYDNGYCQSTDHLYAVWKLCQEYAPIVTDTQWVDSLHLSKDKRKKIKASINATNIPVFMFSVCCDETNFNPCGMNINKNKTIDSGITQINQQNFAEIDNLLPKDLRERKWDSIEKNIMGRYIWIQQRSAANLPWDIMTKKRGWKLYKRIMTRVNHKTIGTIYAN